jgi:copper chaperone CopZ
MKNIVVIFCICFLIPFTAKAEQATKASVITVKISGLTCGSCARSLKENFQKLPETETAQIDIATGTLTITLKPLRNLSDDIIRQLIETPGYKIEKITRSQATTHPRQDPLVSSSP